MFLRYNLTAILWAIVILVLCSIPGTDIIQFRLWDVLNSDKLAHAFVFLLLSVLLIRGFSEQYSIDFLRYYPVMTAVISAIAYGGFTEWWQGAMFPYRTADVLDFAANSFGSILGIFAYRFLHFRGLA